MSAAPAAVGGLFHRNADAEQAASALLLAGVARDAIRYVDLPDPVGNALGPLGIPREALAEYERRVQPGDVLLIVQSDALPGDALAEAIAAAGGLVVRAGRTPAGRPGER
jgi:hypothetical protein